MTIATAPLLDGTLIAEEIALESEAFTLGKQRYHQLKDETIARGDGASLKPVERMLRHWFTPMREAVRQEQRNIRMGQGGPASHLYAEMLLSLSADKIAVITMHEMLSACVKMPGGVYRNKLYFDIGNAIAGECNMNAVRRKDSKDFEKLERSAKRMTPQRANRWARRTLDHAFGGRAACTATGNLLYWMLVGVATCAGYDKEFVLAFKQFSHRGARRKKRQHEPTQFVGLTDAAWKIIEDGHRAREVMRPRYLPMLVPPYPWQEKGDVPGGYIHIRSPLTAKPTPEQASALKAADLSELYECLTAVSSTKWRVNADILGVMEELWESGGVEAGLPLADSIVIPPIPADFHDNADSKKAWKREAATIHKKNVQLRSDRVHFLQKLSIAEKFKGREIYFPHWCCFRTRVYPIPLYLNHQGDDVCRGLLEFAEGKSTENENRRPRAWLYVHAANTYGHDKLAFEERIQWTHNAMDKIIQCAEAPLETIEWWGQADKPWQFLAACMALADPEKAAHLPIQVDGTANGLQHYSAMGRDSVGAKAVNLIASECPSDPYTEVAAQTLELVEADATAGHPLAQRVEEFVGRKLCKPKVMTTVYGVTAVGARKQIQPYLSEKGLMGQELYDCSVYLERVISKALGSICHGAQLQMDWLRECAKLITAQGQLIRWTTPLGAPVVQPYRTGTKIRVRTSSGKITLRDHGGKVKVGKHINGLAPNFVHSLDATHMLWTAKACASIGVTFAAVHDSYWTHAATVDDMSRILREQFIRLHSVDRLAELRRQFQATYPGIEFPECPPRGDFDLNQVMSSTYFFS